MFLNIGYNNAVPVERIIAIVNPDAKPVKRLRENAFKESRLIDATNGRKTRSVIIMDNNHIILSSANPETLIQRINNENAK
jgi:hypothetical protein